MPGNFKVIQSKTLDFCGSSFICAPKKYTKELLASQHQLWPTKSFLGFAWWLYPPLHSHTYNSFFSISCFRQFHIDFFFALLRSIFAHTLKLEIKWNFVISCILVITRSFGSYLLWGFFASGNVRLISHLYHCQQAI